MEIRKNFGKFWVPGLILAAIIGAFNWLISYLSLALYFSFQPAWLWQILIGIAGLLIFIFVPWIYGRLIKWMYENFKLDRY